MGVAHAFALLAGLGARTIFRVFTDAPVVKFVLALALTGGVVNLCQQTIFATDWKFAGENRYASSEAHNPYAYAHTVPNLLALSGRIHELAQKHPAGKDMPVQVIQRSDLGWPLPWYLRDLTHVGYQAEVPNKINAAVVVVDADLEPEALKKLGEGWESSLWMLRAGVALNLLVDKSLGGNNTDEPGDGGSFLAVGTPPPPKPTPKPKPAVQAADTIGTPAPVSPAPEATPAPLANGTAPLASVATPTTGGEAMPPKAQLVEDEPPLVGPPYPVPPPLLFPPEQPRTPRNN
jgi:hypothetical protein